MKEEKKKNRKNKNDHEGKKVVTASGSESSGRESNINSVAAVVGEVVQE
jgi:hypothetical protein